MRCLGKCQQCGDAVITRLHALQAGFHCVDTRHRCLQFTCQAQGDACVGDAAGIGMRTSLRQRRLCHTPQAFARSDLVRLHRQRGLEQLACAAAIGGRQPPCLQRRLCLQA